MASGKFADSFSSPKVAATRAFAEDAYFVAKQGNVSRCKYGEHGTVTGVYVGMEYGMEKIRGTRDWKNAMIGGALTGAMLSAATKNSRDKIVTDPIAGGAITTAAAFINYLT